MAFTIARPITLLQQAGDAKPLRPLALDEGAERRIRVFVAIEHNGREPASRPERPLPRKIVPIRRHIGPNIAKIVRPR